MAALQEKRNSDLQDDGLQATQALDSSRSAAETTEDEPCLLRNRPRSGATGQKDSLFQTDRGTHGTVEIANRTDSHTGTRPEEGTTTYTCQTNYCYYCCVATREQSRSIYLSARWDCWSLSRSHLCYAFRLFSKICYALRLFSPIYPCKTTCYI